MKKCFLIILALCLIVPLASCGVQVTGLRMDLDESVMVEESVIASLTAEYNNANAQDTDKMKAFDELDIIWSSSNTRVATVDENGKVTGISAGTSMISATAGEWRAEKNITVFVPLEGIDAPAVLELTLHKNENAKLNVKPVPANASVMGIYSYTSNHEAVATVDKNGMVAAHANGEAIITITLDGKTAQTKITVTTAATGICLESENGWISIGGSYAIQAYPVPEGASIDPYIYTSSDEKVAVVDAAGVVTGKAPGTAKITVKSAEGLEAIYNVTVKAKSAATQSDANEIGNAMPDFGSASTGGSSASGGIKYHDGPLPGVIDNGDGTYTMGSTTYHFCQKHNGYYTGPHCPYGCDCDWVFCFEGARPTCLDVGYDIYLCSHPDCGLSMALPIPIGDHNFNAHNYLGQVLCRWCGMLMPGQETPPTDSTAAPANPSENPEDINP